MATRRITLHNARGRRVCAAALADTFPTRLRGLLGLRGLPMGEGLLIKPAPSIHTMFMRFPIDAVFLDADLRVLEVRPGLRPWRMAGRRGAKQVLELRAGGAVECGLRAGDRLRAKEAA